MCLILCEVMLGNTQFMHTFIVCNSLQEELVIGLDMHLTCNWTEIICMFLYQGANV